MRGTPAVLTTAAANHSSHPFRASVCWMNSPHSRRLCMRLPHVWGSWVWRANGIS